MACTDGQEPLLLILIKSNCNMDMYGIHNKVWYENTDAFPYLTIVVTDV